MQIGHTILNMSHKRNATQVQQINRKLPILWCFFLTLSCPWNKQTTDRVSSAENMALSIPNPPLPPRAFDGHLTCILKCLSNAQEVGGRMGRLELTEPQSHQ